MIRRQVLAGLLCSGLLCAGLASCGGQGDELSRLARGESGRVIEVRQGDALVLDSGLEVRLSGVEAPHNDDPGAQGARQALAALTLNREVQLFYGGAKRDRYGRAIAHVRVKGGPWLQRAMLEAGQARVHAWPDNQALARPMLSQETKAREAGRGLWALPAYRVMLPSEAAGAMGFVVMEGRVARLNADRRTVLIIFSEGGAVAELSSSALNDLSAAHIEYRSWSGKILRVRGRLSGGSVRVDDYSSIELINS